nr:Chain C, THR-ARG-ARG-GLU-THR-GLN-LEU [Human papillomavirus 16]6TWQ_D Chain D, THR-ARG-ARG-GLU-THR-GLN-LEU [Human papillomavirus 16]8B87_C Chain C, Protein E6 [Human papillomavirus 16]8B87_D Chain D, Protein E6 [Human papillomavirus 16]8B9T_B Chain B, Protein E6 [Human papillomavirus 16]
SSRTRRETQL